MFKYAAKRLESFAFVGLGEDLHSSVEVAAAALERPLDGPAYVPGELFIPGVKKVKVRTGLNHGHTGEGGGEGGEGR
jgi:hypothetical protein